MNSHNNLPRKDKLESQAGADVLLAPGGGGIAIWVRRDELQPRSATRFRTGNAEGEKIDVVDVATMLAALAVGIDLTIVAHAKSMDMDAKLLADMVKTAADALRPKYEVLSHFYVQGERR